MDHLHLVGPPSRPLQVPSQAPQFSPGSPQDPPKSSPSPTPVPAEPLRAGGAGAPAPRGERVLLEGNGSCKGPKTAGCGEVGGGYDTSGLVGPEGQLSAQPWGAPGAFRVREGQGRSPAGTKAVWAAGARGLGGWDRAEADHMTSRRPRRGDRLGCLPSSPRGPGWGAGLPGGVGAGQGRRPVAEALLAPPKH